MELEILWTPQAIRGLETVIEYLETEWTTKEIIKLRGKINEVSNHISKNPYLFPISKEKRNIHKALIDKNNYIIYRHNSAKGLIEIINFRGTRQKPL